MAACITATASKMDGENNAAATCDRSSEQLTKNDVNVAQLPPEKLAFLKKIPKLALEQMGFGDLDFEQDEDFLSESSISESDYQLLQQDDFFDLIKEIQQGIKEEKKRKSDSRS